MYPPSFAVYITLGIKFHHLMATRVDWFFGRGLSIGCGLQWSVPEDWAMLERPVLVNRIVHAVRNEMEQPHIDTTDIREFLSFLAQRTTVPWQHQFHTTNWDYLLQREISALELCAQPQWCANTHVYHLNGTVESLDDNQHRSAIVLETDPASARTPTTETNTAFSKIIWNTTFVIVGMSFECEVDKFILHSLNRVQDDLPIGESHWILVNPNANALVATSRRLQEALPNGRIVTVASFFGEWLRSEMPELQVTGAVDANPEFQRTAFGSC